MQRAIGYVVSGGSRMGVDAVEFVTSDMAEAAAFAFKMRAEIGSGRVDLIVVTDGNQGRIKAHNFAADDPWEGGLPAVGASTCATSIYEMMDAVIHGWIG